MPVAIIKDQIFLQHDPGEHHPEQPERLKRIYQRLEQPDLAEITTVLSPRAAIREELLWNHAPEYIDQIEATAGKIRVQLDPDTATSPDSYQAALKAVGAQFVGLEALFQGLCKAVFALVRPPGHHAEYDRAMGFCIFNNVALAAHYVLKRLQGKRVLIIDWDLHHGNGTQHAFYKSAEVLYFSVHQFPDYPGTGRAEEIGQGPGAGFNVNVPFPPGCGDKEYASAFRNILVPVAEQFSPDVILVSAGFDIYYADPLGGMSVTPVGIAYMTRVVKDLAEKLCQGRLLLTLEGGYNLQGLVECVSAVIFELFGRSIIPDDRLQELQNCPGLTEVELHIKELLKPYWRFY